MSTHKQGGKARQHKRPTGKRLGVKVTKGQGIGAGMVLVRQRGAKYKAGLGTRLGRDFTLYSIATGTVDFSKKFARNVISVIEK
mgnify:CR=1 FL=1